MNKLLSIIIPVFNEETTLPQLTSELTAAMDSLGFDYEIIFVNDASTDRSGAVIDSLAGSNSKIKYLEFSRNFGKELATSAGLAHAAGDAAIMIDADLQHPVEIVPQFIRKWQDGNEVVIGVRQNNKGQGMMKKMGGLVFYKIMSRIGHTRIIPHATDFRLIDRKVINEFNRFSERERITRGLIDWLGFKKDYIYFDAAKRNHGKALGFFGLARLAVSSFINHSLFPLRLAGYLGGIIIIFSGLFGLFIFIEKYLLNDPLDMNFSGPAILAVINLFLVGVILSSLGLIALYIGSIHSEVMNRPMYVVRKKKNLS
jgi:dolichol-phosphate mannosyltransferase